MRRARPFLAIAAAAFVVGAAAAIAVWQAQGAPAAAGRAGCAAPPRLATIDAALVHTAARLAAGGRLKVVAIGSSSTSGVGATSPAKSYPSRLQARLRAGLPGVDILVLNRGIGGQDVAEEILRIQRDVLGQHPDLVIWQLGTNAVLRRDDLTADERLIRSGVAMMTQARIDVVLMDLQYAPRVLRRPAYGEMERIIADTARQSGVGLFRRFAIMRRWAATGQFAPGRMIAPDGLHMTDASYDCLAAALAAALLDDVDDQRPQEWQARIAGLIP